MTVITRLLVANRAEIASRVFRTCRGLGIETVAVHAEADAHLPYVREADTAVALRGNNPAETYLDVEQLLSAAWQAGADAIHPGYGFLSENAAFARAVIQAGLTWVGPDPESIEQMGSKIAAKELMAAGGVPVLVNHTPESATEADLPLLVKASAGGGGRGMRIVRALADLPGEVAAAEAEALSAFGDGTVFVETYVERGRHVEVQVYGDGNRNISVLGERDCSIQRRHQKVVEEAPAPGAISSETLQAMYAAARAAAAAIGYRSTGTVEFLYDEVTERFFFLEMNTRLQVEHPVTEEVTGLDLVELQIAAAERQGAWAYHDDGPRGHAIEVRLYAEDPAADYQPQSGLLTCFEIPGARGEEPGVRVESGFETGSTVSTHYDAMLAKVIVHAPTRRQAARRLAGVLRRARIHGLLTNRDLLVEILTCEDFLAERVSTAFLDGWSFEPRPGAGTWVTMAAHAATVLRVHRLVGRRTVQSGIPPGWRNVSSGFQEMSWQPVPGEDRDVRDVHWGSDGGEVGFPNADIEVVSVRDDAVRLRFEQDHGTFRVAFTGLDDTVADVDGPGGHLRLTLVPRFVDPTDQVSAGSLLAPMPGTVVSVAVEVGQQVVAGQPVLVLEAMKMQHTVSAPGPGTLTELTVQPGAQVAAGEVLAVVEETS